MVRSPLRLLRRSGNPQDGTASPSNTPLEDSIRDASQGTAREQSGDRRNGGGATDAAGRLDPDMAAPSEQVVLLLNRTDMSLPARLWRKVQVAAFQYHITFAFNCFDLWEQLLGNAILAAAAGLFGYGLWRQGAAGIRATASLWHSWSSS